MIKNNKIAIGIFLILSLFNLFFPPIILSVNGLIRERYFFKYLFDMNELYQVDIKTLILLFLISLIISVIVQFIFLSILKMFNRKSNSI